MTLSDSGTGCTDNLNGQALDLFDQITSYENLKWAFNKSQRGKSKYKPEALEFAKNETYNLYELQKELINGTYEFQGYISFKVHEPKERDIMAPHYRDKIVQLAINNVLKAVYQPGLIYDTYACLDNKGTHRCADRISYFLRKAKWEYGDNAYIVKIDIRKFFYTINREILKKLLARKIKCKKTLDLLFKIIDSADAIDLLGLPLGNTLSQLGANVYLNTVDQFCKRRLGIKYYIRYADDIVIVLPDKNEANRVLRLVMEHIITRLQLNCNTDKTRIFPIKQGVNTVGYKMHATHRMLRNSAKKKIKKKLKKIPQLVLDGTMPVAKAEQIISSWFGHASKACSYNFIRRLIEKYGFIYFNKKGVLKINIRKLRKGE